SFLLLTAGARADDSPAWKQLRSPAGHFSVRMPAEWTGKKEAKGKTFSARFGALVFGVSYRAWDGWRLRSLEGVEKALVKELGGERSRSAPLTWLKHPSVEVVIALPDGSVSRNRLVGAGTLYRIWVAGRKEGVTSAIADEFLDSLELLPLKKVLVVGP